MSQLLTWDDASKKHRGQLGVFVCTDWQKPRDLHGWPPKGDAHRGWWEFEVQRNLRGLTPPLKAGQFARVGCDDEGLAAVSVVLELDGPRVVEWEFGAIALRHRRKGGGYADEMCRDLFDVLTSRAVEADTSSVTIYGNIFEANRASQEMSRRHGFVHTGEAAEGVQIWQRELLVAV